MSGSRADSAAVTRRTLLDAAGGLLDLGGPAAVTLREVGARAGVSPSAAYRHFADKSELLDALGGMAWEELAQKADEVVADGSLSAEEALRGVVTVLLDLARRRPHLYRVMQASTVDHPDPASKARESLLTTVRRGTAAEDAPVFAGVLLVAAHGVADLETHGYLSKEKWGVDGDRLIDAVIRLVSSP